MTYITDPPAGSKPSQLLPSCVTLYADYATLWGSDVSLLKFFRVIAGHKDIVFRVTLDSKHRSKHCWRVSPSSHLINTWYLTGNIFSCILLRMDVALLMKFSPLHTMPPSTEIPLVSGLKTRVEQHWLNILWRCESFVIWCCHCLLLMPLVPSYAPGHRVECVRGHCGLSPPPVADFQAIS